MKLNRMLLVLVLSLVMVSLVGCSKKDGLKDEEDGNSDEYLMKTGVNTGLNVVEAFYDGDNYIVRVGALDGKLEVYKGNALVDTLDGYYSGSIVNTFESTTSYDVSTYNEEITEGVYKCTNDEGRNYIKYLKDRGYEVKYMVANSRLAEYYLWRSNSDILRVIMNNDHLLQSQVDKIPDLNLQSYVELISVD